MRHLSNKSKSIWAMIISTASFTLMGMCVKLAGDIPSTQKLIFRAITIMCVSFILMKRQKVKLRKIKHHKWLMLRSLLGTCGIICNYYAIDHLILSDSNIIFRMTTMILLLTSWIFLGERVSAKQLLLILVAFLGVLLVVKPEFSLELVPYLIAILGACFAALAYTTLRVVGQKEHYMAIVFYFAAFTFVTILPYVIYNFQPMMPIQVIAVIAAGVFAAFGQFGVTVAYKLAPAKEVSIYNYLGVVFAAVISILVFRQMPDMYSVLGYIVIFAASYAMYKLNNRQVIEQT